MKRTERNRAWIAIALSAGVCLVGLGSEGCFPDAGPTRGGDAGSVGEATGDGGVDAGEELTSQHRYSYPGCEDAGGYGCPNMLVFYCAMRTIEARHNSCSSPADCVPVFVRNCVGALSGCPPAAVNDAGLAAFVAETEAESWSYCGDGGATCGSSYSCGYSYSSKFADCANGRCVPVLADGGQP